MNANLLIYSIASSQKLETMAVWLKKWMDDENNGMLPISTRNEEVLSHSSTWMNCDDILLSETEQTNERNIKNSMYIKFSGEVN